METCSQPVSRFKGFIRRPGGAWRRLRLTASLLVAGLLAATPVVGGAAEIDPASGLIVDEHWELVRAHCGACHSTRLVTQNRGDRETWLKMIRWMQETQGLWAINGPQEDAILDYLARNYAPAAAARRAMLAPDLLPPNPYDKN